MKKSYTTFLSLALIIGTSTNVVSQDYEYAFSVGGSFNDRVYTMTQDVDYNIYISGDFTGTADFDPSSGTANLVCPMAPCSYIAKYDSSGNYKWAKLLQANFGPMEGRALQIDNAGDLCLSGLFIDSVDFDPSPAIAKLGSQGAHDAFIAKYDTAGNYIWAKSFGGPAPDYIYSMDIDKQDNIYVAGYFIFMADFDPSGGTAILNAHSGSPDAFLAKYDANGNYLWAKNIGGPMQDEANSIKVDTAGNAYLTGFFNGAVDFDPGPGSVLVASQGLNDIFITKYDNAGNMVWAHGIGGADNDRGLSLDLDNLANIYLTGSFSSTTDFDPSTGAVANLVAVGGTDAFIAKYDSSGAYVWAKGMGGSSQEVAKVIIYDNDNLYITGQFNSSTADFDPSSSVANISSIGGDDIFMAKYDNSGNYTWANVVGGLSMDFPNTMLIEDAKSLYIGGAFDGVADFDPSAATANLNPVAGIDLFVAKYSFCKTLMTTIEDTICDGELYMFNGVLIATAGTYQDTLQNSQGCDSILILNLEVELVDVSVTQTDDSVLTSNASGANYQWIDCNDNNLPITGETAQTFTASLNGSYAVIVAKGICRDTSACLTVSSIDTTIGINEFGKSGIRVYPNPSKGVFNIQLDKTQLLNVYSITGKEVFSAKLPAGNQRIDLSGLEEGFYFLRVIGSKQTLKLVMLK